MHTLLSGDKDHLEEMSSTPILTPETLSAAGKDMQAAISAPINSHDTRSAEDMDHLQTSDTHTLTREAGGSGLTEDSNLVRKCEGEYPPSHSPGYLPPWPTLALEEGGAHSGEETSPDLDSVFEEDHPPSHAPWLLPPWPPPNSLRNTNHMDENQGLLNHSGHIGEVAYASSL